MWLAEVDEALTEWELRIRRFFLAASIRISSALLTATLSGLEIFRSKLSDSTSRLLWHKKGGQSSYPADRAIFIRWITYPPFDCESANFHFSIFSILILSPILDLSHPGQHIYLLNPVDFHGLRKWTIHRLIWRILAEACSICVRVCISLSICFAGIQKSGHYDSFVDFEFCCWWDSQLYSLLDHGYEHTRTAYCQDRWTNVSCLEFSAIYKDTFLELVVTWPYLVHQPGQSYRQLS